MNPTYKAPWIAALRSGNYKQTTGYLRNEKGHCCLGVLCEAAGWPIDETGEGVADYGDGTYDVFTERAGIPRVHFEHLYRMNDSGKTFPEIADWIEANL